MFGQGLLFVNSYEAAVDLLEKRGAIYSDKPKMVMAGELCALLSCFRPLHMSDPSLCTDAGARTWYATATAAPNSVR